VDDRAGRSLFGFGLDERLAFRYFDRVHPEDRSAGKAIRQAIQARSEYDMEYRVQQPDGTVR
jgi:hypothetical protein